MYFPHGTGSFTNGSHETTSLELAADYMTNFEDYLRFGRPYDYREIIKSLKVLRSEKDPLEWQLTPVVFLTEVQ